MAAAAKEYSSTAVVTSCVVVLCTEKNILHLKLLCCYIVRAAVRHGDCKVDKPDAGSLGRALPCRTDVPLLICSLDPFIGSLFFFRAKTRVVCIYLWQQ